MVRVKRMDEGYFAQLLKDFNVWGELVRSRQDEKQALLNQFDAESKRFFFGKISERAFASSVKKTNLELQRLDREVRGSIAHAKRLADRARSFVARQAPIGFRATLSGTSTPGAKKTKKITKKMAKKKKAAKKKTKKKATRKKKKR